MTSRRAVPLAVGVGLLVLALVDRSVSGVAFVMAALSLGAVWPERALSVGAWLAVPLALAAIVSAATDSAGWLAIAVVAGPFVIATSALLAVAGSFIGHALGRGNEVV